MRREGDGGEVRDRETEKYSWKWQRVRPEA